MNTRRPLRGYQSPQPVPKPRPNEHEHADTLRRDLMRKPKVELLLALHDALADLELAEAETVSLEGHVDALLAERQQAIDALRVYADARNWGISRDDLAVRVLSWIGPGEIRNGIQDGTEVARAALVKLGEKP